MLHGDPWCTHRMKQYALVNKPAATQYPPFLEAEQQTRNSQSQKTRGCCNLDPSVCIFHQTLSRLPVANHIFLGLWIVHNFQECHSLRSAPLRSDTWHSRDCDSWCTLQTECPGQGRCIRCTARLGQYVHQALGHLSGSDLGKAQNAQPIWVFALVEHPRT